MKAAFEFLALCSCGLFAGAALYVNLVEHPARMSCGIAVALAEFRPSYKRATIMQASSSNFFRFWDCGLAGARRLDFARRRFADRGGHTVYIDFHSADESQLA